MFFKKKTDPGIPTSTAVVAAVAVVALLTAVWTAKWSLYMVNDLVSLRKDFAKLQNEQEQLKIQFDFWDQKVSEERMMIRKLKESMTPPAGMMPPQ